MKSPKNCRCCRKSLVTGYVKFLLCADGEPWLAGRTVVPVSTLSGPELALQKLGKTPLGRYLFTSSTLTRDFIEIGRDAGLWGRRSRLRLSGKPLLLTELFFTGVTVVLRGKKYGVESDAE